MKKVLNCIIISMFVLSANVFAGEFDGLWNFRANGTAVGFMDLNGITGTIRLGSSGEDSVQIITLKSTGSIGAKKIRIIRRGSYNQEFIGWVSYDGKQMAGYYIHNGQELPWSAVK